MLGFHHFVAVLPLPFRRSAVVKFRCSVKITKKIPFRYSLKQQTAKRYTTAAATATATVYGNGNG